MAYGNSAILHLPFNTLPLVEAVNGVAATYATTPVLEPTKFGNGVVLSTYPITVGGLNSISNTFTMSFMLKSVNPGVVTNPNTNATEPLCMPLLAKSNFSLVNNVYSTVSASFVIYERTLATGKNQLVIYLDGHNTGGGSVNFTYTTAAYTVGEIHHFIIVYDGPSSTFNVYIDQVITSGQSTGTLPANINSNSYDLAINDKCPGPTYAIAKNGATLDDLVVFSDVLTTNERLRLFNLGALWVADTSLSDVSEIHTAIVFDDPSSTKINSVVALRGNVYIARSDGKLLKGVRSIWESRRIFNDDKELAGLTVVSKSDDILEIEDGLLTVTSHVIRI